MFEVGQLIENQYLVLEIRRGRRWIVYITQDGISERVFIIKRPSESYYADAFDTETFLNRARTWIELGECDRIANAYMLKMFGGVPHLFIEYVDGPSLADILCSRPGKPLPIDQTIALMTEFIGGMKFLHRATFLDSEREAVHGNLTPSNILTTSGNIKITDIGISRAFGFPSKISITEFFSERIPYLAPEQQDDPTLEDRLSEIYSFGAIMYEVATGTPPARARRANAPSNPAFASSMVPPTMRNRQCPRWLEETIQKCMAQRPENRFQSFEQIETLFNEILKAGEIHEGEVEEDLAPKRTSRVARIRGMAKKESSRLNQYYLGVEHMMLSLLTEEESIVTSVLGDNVMPEKLREEILSQLPKGEGPWGWESMKKTPRYKRTMRLARRIQRTYSDERMLPQHILLAILKEGHSIPVRALRNLGIDIGETSQKLQKELSQRRPSILVTDFHSPAARFTNRVSSTTEGAYFVPFSGRQVELKTAQDLLLREKYSVLVIGEPGVGKTAFVRELACAVSETASDEGFEYGSMHRLRTPVLLASAENEDDLLENFRGILDEIIESKSILIVEDLPLLLCLCANVPSHAADLLDEYISSKGLLIVATATPEGRALCESKHSNIMQFLEVVNLQEPPEGDTFQMLKGAKESFEVEHSVGIANNVLTAVLNLSMGLKTDRALPARAFELLDLACMSAKLRSGKSEKTGSKISVTAEQVRRIVGDLSRPGG